MGKSIAVTVAALIAAAVTAWPPSSSTVAAGVAPAPLAPIPAPACTARAWPYNRCDPLAADGKSTVRLVTADRLPADFDRR